MPGERFAKKLYIHIILLIKSPSIFPIYHGDSCYRHFCASHHGAWNVNNYRDPQSLNMLFLPLKEQGHQTTALPISSPPENTSKQAYFGSCHLLN